MPSMSASRSGAGGGANSAPARKAEVAKFATLSADISHWLRKRGKVRPIV